MKGSPPKWGAFRLNGSSPRIGGIHPRESSAGLFHHHEELPTVFLIEFRMICQKIQPLNAHAARIPPCEIQKIFREAPAAVLFFHEQNAHIRHQITALMEIVFDDPGTRDDFASVPDDIPLGDFISPLDAL